MTVEEALKKSFAKFPKPQAPRKATDPYDFGDDATIMLHVKKKGYANAKITDRVYGRYLGCLDNKYVIGAYDLLNWFPQEIIEFDTLEELKAQWTLD